MLSSGPRTPACPAGTSGTQGNPNPTPNDDAKGYVAETLGSIGAQVHSSQWTGWVPGGNCGGGGGLDDSVFSVSNVKIMGAVVQGAEPARC